MLESGAAAGPDAAPAAGSSAHERQPRRTELLRMGELAEASGVPAPTIKHYLREGLLPEPVKTSRNMAYYPPEFVDRIQLIKRLQEERFMPLKAIKAVLDEDPERAEALLELEDRILDRALAGERARTSAAEVRKRYGVPEEVLDRLAELEILTPNSRGYSPSDVTIIEAISRFRAGGYDEQIGFTVYDTLRYKTALEELVRQEVDVVMNRLAGEVPPERVVEMLEAGAQPLKDLIAALHTKLLVAELERQRDAAVERLAGRCSSGVAFGRDVRSAAASCGRRLARDRGRPRRAPRDAVARRRPPAPAASASSAERAGSSSCPARARVRDRRLGRRRAPPRSRPTPSSARARSGRARPPSRRRCPSPRGRAARPLRSSSSAASYSPASIRT